MNMICLAFYRRLVGLSSEIYVVTLYRAVNSTNAKFCDPERETISDASVSFVFNKDLWNEEIYV